MNPVVVPIVIAMSIPFSLALVLVITVLLTSAGLWHAAVTEWSHRAHITPAIKSCSLMERKGLGFVFIRTSWWGSMLWPRLPRRRRWPPSPWQTRCAGLRSWPGHSRDLQGDRIGLCSFNDNQVLLTDASSYVKSLTLRLGGEFHTSDVLDNTRRVLDQISLCFFFVWLNVGWFEKHLSK